MKCPRCKNENKKGAKFCNDCGYKLSSLPYKAPSGITLEEKIDKIQRYLPKGLTEKILSQRDKIEGERKQVTVMFCDMVDFTPMVEYLGPDKTYMVMDQVYELLIHKVHEYEGTVNEMTGDGIMALFGAPLAVEDAPQRAIRSALAINEEIRSFNESYDVSPPIRMRTGIHTGDVIVGTLGNDLRVEFKAVGDTVNLASRMEGLAEPDSVYVTEETYQLTKELFKFENLGAKRIKGKKTVVPVHKALSSKEDVFRPRLGEERMIYSEMVGRGKELNKLELQVMKAINGEGSVVNIIGEAGIGKSRLVAELKNHDVMKQVTMLEGSAISIGKNLSFHPIIDLIKQWAKIKTKDSDTDAFKKLELAVQSVDFENSNEIIPFVATLMGMKLSPNYAERIVGIEGKALEKLLFKNVRDLLIKATKSTPIVIIIEDLHWSDRSSIDLLSSLYRLAENYSILFINVFRPGYSETSDQIVKVLKDELSVYYVEISIEPLDGQLSEALIINMLKISGLPYNVMENIVSRSDGNPFFIEEVVRSLIDTGAVILKDGGYEVTEQINHVSIPHSINEVLMARIDHLDESNRNLVKIASVIGRNFFYRVLDKVAEDIEDVDGILSYLKAIQLIRERERLDEIQYIFKHALAQEAAYKSILETRRTALHLKIAASIEKIFRDRLYEFYGILSYHYIRGDDHDKAEEFLLKAGEEAIRSSASSEAIYYYKEALKLYLNKHGEHADNKTIIKMEKNIALALYNKGLNAEALEYFDRVLLKYGVKIPKHSITSIAKAFVDFISYLLSLYIPFLKWHKTANRQDNEIIDILVKKLTVLSISDMTAFLKYQFSLTRRLSKYKIDTVENGVEILAGSSLMFSWSGISFGLSRKVLAFVKKKVNIHETNNSPILQFTTLMYNTLTGENLQKEEPYNTQLIEDGLRSGELFYTTFYINLNMLHSIDRGQYVNASTQKERLLEIYDAYGFETARILYFYGSAKLLMKYRKFRKASYDIKVGFEFLTKIDSKFHLIGLLSCQARIHIMRGDHKSARSTLKQAKKIMPRLIPAFYYTEYLLSRFCYETSKIENSVKADKNASTQKNIKKAFSAGKMAINNSRKIAVNRVEIFRVMGRLYWLVNRQNKAMDFWNKSVEHGKYMGHKLELSRTYFEIGSRLLAKSSNYNDFNGISAEEYLDKARTMFDEMNLKWDLEQLKRLQTYS